MRIIVGLGNPGKKYEDTRHNAGFLALDFIAKKHAFDPWEEKKKLLATIAEGHIKGEKILLVKPSVFMNDSGQTVNKVLSFYKLTPADLVVIHDDIDILSGTLRNTSSSRAAGHNGVANIIEHLGTQDFRRSRIGVGRPTEVLGVCQPSHDYVLGKFTPEERTALDTLFKESFKDYSFLLGS
ncbi:MAG: aminoacyl-tRNA hydrolase [Patescibacteria group bacterium]